MVIVLLIYFISFYEDLFKENYNCQRKNTMNPAREKYMYYIINLSISISP